MTYNLSPADLADLRVDAKRRGSLANGGFGPEQCSVPFIVYAASTEEFVLHSQGFVAAVSKRAEVVCWLLAQERVQAGYVRSILRPDLSPDLALNPVAAARAKAADAAFYARLRQEERDEDARRERRRTQLVQKPASDLTLDDLP